MLRDIANASDKEYNLIHPKVTYLVPILGITPLSDHLNITEDVFDDAGQHEPLTTRLCNILKEYKDDITIIKEMIQNADDAGATKVNILYDSRTYSTQKLLFKGMAESHGPALIVHNDSTFTKEDFENITKLAGATKANQPLKIGKFGVGFCSVYHITDVPSFVSGEWLYIFDPTLKYLKGVVHDQSKPGKKIKYQQSRIFSNCQDLVPYEGLFGFKSSSNYKGTMFRFPFRTSMSQISSKVYDEHIVEHMKRDLVDCGSKLLLFLQHMKHITFSSRRDNEEITHVSIDISSSNSNDFQKVVIKSPCIESSTEHWLIASQEGQWQHQNITKPAVASVACQLDEGNLGFYKCKEVEGAAFCFLPLAMPSTGLPVHVSANFAVMSNRSGIWTEVSSDTVTDSRVQWNKNLMEKTIPKAYCKLLQKLQAMHCSGTLLNYEFYFLWPLAKRMKYPYVSLVKPLINILSEQKLFYSASLNKWQTLEQSCFIPSPLFSIAGKCSFPEEALSILQLPVVSLPPDHMQQLQNLNDSLHVLNENEFTSCFLSNIASFNAQIQIRNEVIFCMLLAIAMSEQINSNEYKNVKSKIKKFPCIPCSPNGINLKVANQLIDPVVFEDIFDPDDAMFPLLSFYQNNLVRPILFEFGMMSEKLSMDIIIKSAKTIESIIVIDKSKAMKRVKAILQYITSPIPDELKKMRFLPVLPKPEDYFIHWKGEGHMLLSPNELICDSRSKAIDTAFIVGSQRAILNTDSVSDGGCGTVRSRVMKLLEIATKPSFDEVLEHFNTLICSFKPPASNGHYELIDKMCHKIYAFLDESLDNVQSQSLSRYYNKPFIWTGKAFVCPRDVAVNWKHNDGPYLYKLPSMLSEKDKLLKCLDIKTTFNYDDILVAFEAMYKDFASHKIPKRNQNIALSMILGLNSMTNDSSQVSNYNGDIILIDNSFTLRYVSQLSFNDSPWLPPDDESFYVHDKLTRGVALTLGVKPIRSRFLNKFAHHSQQSFLGVPFGQKEELTRRIRNILQEYPLDATFLKELLQNADDAKATKIRIILDKRQHGNETVPSETWGKELQGPALLVWNDKEFSDVDLEGIQKLGLGSKRDDDESIGQFGIGFNVVYHLTDCPSFITRGNTLCVFDPHCKYVPEADYSCPGRQYNIDDYFLEIMSDLQSSFLRISPSNIHLPDNLTTGTLFRFPLRTQSGFESTELLDKTTHLSVSVIERKLTEWVNEIEDALLFLNHIKQFSFYIIDDRHSSLKLSYEINISQEDQQQREGFHQKLLSFKSSKKPFIVTYPIQLSILKPHNEEVTKRWLIQNGVGNDRVQPKYGIAAPLDGDTHIQGRVFCFLPLPVFTNLPVHVNGQFALNNNRRSLWNGDKEDDKIKWNRFILQAIASCYALLLDKARSYFISESESYSSQDVSSLVNSYYDLFPLFDKGGDSGRLEGDWHTLALNVVQHLYNHNISVLAIEVKTSQSKVKMEWCPLKSDNGFTQVYFQPEYVKSILPVVNKIQMSVTCAPHNIYQNFKEVFDPPVVSPVSVFSFYTNFYSLILTSGVPVKLQESPFQTIQCFQDFLKYILCNSSEFPKSPIGYPLLLTSDDILRNFNENDQVLFSSYSSLFSDSKDKFLHPELFNVSLSRYYFLSISSSSLFSHISKILDDNLPSKLKGDEAPSNVIDGCTLKELWECITTDDYFIVYQNEIVQEWALLPARNNKLYSSSSDILPVVEPGMKDDAFNILEGLNVPILISEGYPQAIINFCPSMTQYDCILNVIFHVCRQDELCFTQKVTTLNDSQIQIITSYLNKTSFYNDKEILDKILCLPLFKSINGTVTKLVEKHVCLWPDDPQFPLEAHDKWAPIDRIVFLERDGSWKCLCPNNFFLLGQELSPTEVYCNIIFPVFDKLDFDERMCHMEYIRKSLFPNLKHALKMTGEQSEKAAKFVNCAKNLPFLVSHSNDDKLYPVNHFVDHTVDIFNSFPDKFNFLVEEYRKKEWLDFLKFIGLCTKVTPEEFIEFCDEVSKNHCKDTSSVLVEYLFSTKATDIHKSPTLLSTICEIPFVCTADLSLLSWIAPPPNNTGFTCFNGAVRFDELNASLLWTVKPVIQLPACCMSVAENKVLNQLRVVTEPSATDVFKNVENISRSHLADFELMSTYTVSRISDSASVIEVIKDNITFIYNHDKSLLKELSLVPFIPVSAEPNNGREVSKPVLVNSLQVVMTINSSGSEKSTRFCPYINALPVSLHYLSFALSEAGVTYSVELKHIQYMLERLHQQCKVISNPNDEELVRNAMQALSDLLKDVTQETEKILEPLYLPSIDDELVLSTKLVYRDRKVYYSHKSEWDFSESQFKLFSIKSSFLLRADDVLEKELCCKLPRKLSPKSLSSVSHNKLESGIISLSHSNLCERLNCLTNLCSISVYCDGLTKIILKVLPDLSEPNAALMVNFIKNLQCKTVTDFTACVMINSIKVGILKAQFLFICDEDQNYTLYSSDEATSTISVKLRKSFAHELCNVLAQVVSNEAIKLKELNELMFKLLDVQSEEDFKSVMEEYDQDVNIDEYLISADDSKPEPGQSMTMHWKSFLDHNVNHIFRPQEWVGYERRDDDFIWAIILHEVQQEDVNNHFLRKFVIQIDNKDEIHEETVSISCLYKLVRREAPVSPNHHQERVPLPHSGIHQDTSEAKAETKDNEVYRLKKEVCEQLRLLWSLPDAERRRGVRRLYLLYHPDKAEPSKVSIYEEVFKFLKCQLNRLENNLPLLDRDVTQYYSHHTGTSFRSQWESNFNQWDKSARNRRYGHSGRGGGGGEGGSSFGGNNFSRSQQSHTTQDSGSFFSFQPQVDMIEAKRWMRQAKSDLQAMNDLFSSSKEEVSSQVIFMAHQVMEKALKAGMYALLGLNEIYLKRHELIVHARALSSCEGSLSQLNNLVSNMEQYYLDTRYPNRHNRPNAPVDKYSLHQASDITKQAEKVYDLINSVIQ
ncbi:PREDICTED: sacsin-like [Amphimedon queenslandica]|nr:PREDICTED: sacsin-like [Amphimedon queenslandica]|eukprot:XP_019850325.1 PREDICTED: sacsin-like [Amphimedon queenslandica]